MANVKTSLMVEGRHVRQLTLDGPALRIVIQDESARLFPLRRVGRIHVLGELVVGFDVLLHCAEQNICVAFFTLQGRLRCQLLAPVPEASALSHWLEAVAWDSDIQQAYEIWLLNQSLYMLALYGFNCGNQDQRLVTVLNAQAQSAAKILGKRQQILAWQWLDGFATAHVSQALSGFGLHNGRSKRKVSTDLMPLIVFWLRAEFLSWQGKSTVPISGRYMAEFFRVQETELQTLLLRMLSQLVGRLEVVV